MAELDVQAVRRKAAGEVAEPDGTLKEICTPEHENQEGDTQGFANDDFEMLKARRVQDDKCRALTRASAAAESDVVRGAMRADAKKAGYLQRFMPQVGRLAGEFYRLEVEQTQK